MDYNRDKLKKLIHYVVWKAGRKQGFGAVKLYKALWFAESRAYMLRGRPIAGGDYIREKNGPIPREGIILRNDLVAEGMISQKKVPYYNVQIWQFSAKSQPDMSEFDILDIQDLDYWIKHIDEDHTAESISDESHNYAWEIAKMGEILPFSAFFVSRIRDMTKSEIDWAESVVKEKRLP